jgi:hypothetical protein
MDESPRAFPPWLVGLLLSLALGNFSFAALWWAARRTPPPPPPPPVTPAEEAAPDEELAVRDRKIIELRAHNAELGRRLEEAQRRLAALTRPPSVEPPVQSSGNPDSKANPTVPSGVHEQYAAWVATAGVPAETAEDVLRLVAERRVAGLSTNLNEVDAAGMEELRRRRQAELERIERRIAGRLGEEAYARFAEFERRRAQPAVRITVPEEEI